jgi:UDP:flavonoid glycosyltransferase YjiC (YdhE family)
MRVSFLTLSLEGHLRPARSLANALRDLGYEVDFVPVPRKEFQVTGYLDSTVALGRLCFEELPGKIAADLLVIDQLFPGGTTSWRSYGCHSDWSSRLECHRSQDQTVEPGVRFHYSA